MNIPFVLEHAVLNKFKSKSAIQTIKRRTKTASDNHQLLEVKRRLTINAAFNAGLWGSAAVSLLTVVDMYGAGLLMAVSDGDMGVGTLTYRCMPDATRSRRSILLSPPPGTTSIALIS